MLTRAFDDDPVARWACPRDELRPWMLERLLSECDRDGVGAYLGSSKERNFD